MASTCKFCEKEFGSRKAVDDHAFAKHGQAKRHKQYQRREQTKSPSRIPAPFPDAEGEWLPRDDFEGDQSFGWFICGGDCGKCWKSAFGRKNYRQGCKSCETMSLPTYMWLNAYERGSDREKSGDGGPHDQERCEACARGKCKLGNKEYR